MLQLDGKNTMNDPTKKSEPAKHLKNNFYHVFNWIILRKVPQNYRVRRNLEAWHISSLKPTLNEQKDFEILTLSGNGVTSIPTCNSC